MNNDKILEENEVLRTAILDGVDIDTERAALSRIKQSKPVAAQTRRRSRTAQVRRTLVLACASLVLVAGVAVAANAIRDTNTQSTSRFRHEAAEQIDHLSADTTRLMTESEAQQLRSLIKTPVITDVAPGIDIQRLQDQLDAPNPNVDTGPHERDFDEMHLSQGRILFEQPGFGKIGAIESNRGDVCAQYWFDGPVSSTCFPDLNTTGVTYVISTGGYGVSIWGLASSDVTSIRVLLADGTVAQARIGTNAWVWHANLGAARPKTLMVNKGNAVQTVRLGRIDS